MKYIVSVLILFAFYKSIFYADFEYKEKKNKIAAIGIYLLSFVGFIFPLFVVFSFY